MHNTSTTLSWGKCELLTSLGVRRSLKTFKHSSVTSFLGRLNQAFPEWSLLYSC